MNVTRLRYFCTVVGTGNLHRAAEVLRVSPAAISKAIKILEEETGMKLTLPAGRGIVITDEGKAFSVRAERVISELDELVATPTAKTSKRPLVRLGSFEVFTTYFLGPLMKGLGEAELVLYELSPGHLEDSLADGFIDLGLTYVPIPRAELDFLEVGQIEMGVYAVKGAFTNLLFDQIPFAVPLTPIRGAPTKVLGLDGWPDHLKRRNIRYRVTLMESALELCRQGLAAAYLPTFVVDLHNAKSQSAYSLQKLRSPLPTKYGRQPVYLVKRKSDPENTHARALARAIRAL